MERLTPPNHLNARPWALYAGKEERMNREFHEAVKDMSKYNVPESIRHTAIEIAKRFQLHGVCDAMYVANCIAQESGSGDGKSHFTSDVITNCDKIAAFLARAYGCNIFPDDMQDLTDILENGSISDERMIEGLNKYIEYCRSEARRWTGRDDWRVEFERKCAKWAQIAIDEIKNGDSTDPDTAIGFYDIEL